MNSALNLRSLLAIGVVSIAAATCAAVLLEGSASPPSRPVRAGVDLGKVWGSALRGRAPGYESLARAETQADAIPAGASVDRPANAVRFAGPTADITLVANPPTGRDMAFRAAGLENPTIEVRKGALVSIRFVNGDSDSAHGWLLLDPVVQTGGTFHGPRAFPGAYAPILGDPTTAGQAMESIQFRASASGTYRYECPVPGHAAMGMQGSFIVTA